MMRDRVDLPQLKRTSIEAKVACIGAAIAARCVSSLHGPANRLQHNICTEGLALSVGLTLV
jgi:hypothetical protein